MASPDTSRRVTSNIIQQDIDAFNGLKTVTGYITARPEATLEALQQAYNEMLAGQSAEIEKQALFKAAADKSKQAEWNFHNAILAMKESVKGQFGSDSDAAQAIGFKKKSERKRPSRKKVEDALINSNV